jgi:hypothetical protein
VEASITIEVSIGVFDRFDDMIAAIVAMSHCA